MIKKIIILLLFSASMCMADPCQDSTGIEYSKKCGRDDVDKLTWFSASFLCPILPYLASKVWSVPEVTDTVTTCPKVYKEAYIEEREEASLAGTILGLVGLLWFGLLIF